MRYALLSLTIILPFNPIIASDSDEITPYKFDDTGIPSYEIPTSSRFTTRRLIEGAPALVYYLSKPHENNYPIVVMCGGGKNQSESATSQSRESATLAISFSRQCNNQ